MPLFFKNASIQRQSLNFIIWETRLFTILCIYICLDPFWCKRGIIQSKCDWIGSILPCSYSVGSLRSVFGTFTSIGIRKLITYDIRVFNLTTYLICISTISSPSKSTILTMTGIGNSCPKNSGLKISPCNSYFSSMSKILKFGTRF